MHGWVEIRADHHLETRRAGGSCLPGGRACVAGQGWPGWPAMKQQCLKADHRRRARGRDAQLGEVGLAAVGQTGRRRRLEGKSQVRHLGLGTGGVSAGHIRPYGRHGRTGSMQRLGPAAQSGFGLFLCDTGRDLWDAKVGELGQPVLTSGSRKYIAAFFFVGVQSFVRFGRLQLAMATGAFATGWAQRCLPVARLRWPAREWKCPSQERGSRLEGGDLLPGSQKDK